MKPSMEIQHQLKNLSNCAINYNTSDYSVTVHISLPVSVSSLGLYRMHKNSLKLCIKSLTILIAEK